MSQNSQKNFNSLFSKSLDNLIISGGKNDYFEAAIQPLLKKVKVNYIDISKYSCMEIDFIEDLELARNLYGSKGK